MAGRKPKPTAIKKLEGNPGKRKLNRKEPVPAKGMPECPDWLLPEAKAEWERLCEKLSDMGVLTEIDMAAFAAYLLWLNALIALLRKCKETRRRLSWLSRAAHFRLLHQRLFMQRARYIRLLSMSWKLPGK